MSMTFDPPPTAEQARKSLHNSSRRSRSNEPPPYTTEDVLAAQHQRLSKLLSTLRIATSAITLVIAIVVIACAANSLQTYSGNNFTKDWGLPLWPMKVDLRPVRAVLSCGIIVTVASIVYLAAALFPSPRPKLHLLNVTSSLLSSLCFFTTLFTAIFASQINSHLADNTTSGSIQSWTCKWSGLRSVAPAEFSKICTESMISLNLVILLVIIEAIAIGTTAWGWWIETRIKKQSEHDQAKLENGSFQL